MGVSGSGKTTVGRLLASRLGVRFVDGDDLHPAANVAKMAGGIPLDDEDRRPWLDLVRSEIARALESGAGLVITCSALKLAYRDRLMWPGEPVVLAFLDGPRDLLEQRLRDRSGHYMPASLLASQLATLERPTGALALDIREDPDALVEQIKRSLGSDVRTVTG